MGNYYADNEDLRFYVERGIDWATLVEHAALGGGTTSTEEAVETYRDVLEMMGAFAADEIAPVAAAADADPPRFVDGEVVFPERLQALFEQMRDLELHGMCVPADLGGMGCPLMLYMLGAEVFARADVSIMAHHGFHGGIAMAALAYSALEGSLEVDVDGRRILASRFDHVIRDILENGQWGSMDLTEPDAGSDLGALRTVGVQADDGTWTVTGSKIFITSGHGRWHFVIARTEPAAEGSLGLDGLSLFLVPAWTEDGDGNRVRHVTVSRLEHKLGHHASATVGLDFDAAPADLVGERGDGFKLMLLLMNNARISVGFEALGLCEAAYRMARDYAAQRPTMGKTIDKHEMIADWLDEMQADIQGLRALAVQAAFHEEVASRKRMMLQYLHAPGTPEHDALAAEVRSLQWRARLITPLIKFRGAEKAVEIARRNLQIHGGYGYMTEYGAEKLLRDAVVLPIYEGTTQIQALMATKDNLLRAVKNPAGFLRKLADTRWRSMFATDPLERRTARIRHQALTAQRSLLTRIARGKLTGRSPATWRAAFKDWDPKRDFSPALLHAGRFTELLTDAAICEALLEQARDHDERREVLERYLDRAEPRCADQLHRIQTTGDRILRMLDAEAGPAADDVARAAK